MIPIQLLNWMQSYLDGKKLYVRLASILSSSQPITSAIIQGSCLALTCFILFKDEPF